MYIVDSIFNLGISILGDYAGFDETEPTSRSGGKAVVIDFLKKTKGYNNLILIGDGATDLEACPPADGFIGIIFNQHFNCLRHISHICKNHFYFDECFLFS